MKFRTLLVAALAAVSLGASAQESPKYEFNPYWTVQLQGGAGYSLGGFDKFTDMITPAAAVSVGYRFAPAFGARVHVSGWEGKNGWDFKFNGKAETYKWNYAQAGLDLVVDVNSLFAGYNPNRPVTLNAILGVSYLHGIKNKNARDWHAANPRQMTLAWEDNKLNTWGARGGLQVDFRLSKRLSLNVEALATATDDRFNSKSSENYVNGKFVGSTKKGNLDWQFNAFAGVSYRIGHINTEPINTYVPAPVVPEPAPAP